MKKKILSILLFLSVLAPAATLLGQMGQTCPMMKCREGFSVNQDTCKCECLFTAKCKEGSIFNKEICQCECSVKIKCAEGFYQDPDNCFNCKKIRRRLGSRGKNGKAWY